MTKWSIKIDHMIIVKTRLIIIILLRGEKDMLNGISAQELANKNLVPDTDIEKIPNTNKNPYAAIDKTLLIDESNISKEAIKLYQRDLEVKKFSFLALSNPEDTSHNKLVMEKVFQADDGEFSEKVIEGMFNNRNFLKDLLG